MNTKDLITNPEFVNNIAEGLEDIPQDSSAKYALWVIGLDEADEPADELFIYEFDTLEEAITKADTIDIKFISEQIDSPILYYCDYTGISYFSVEVETVVPDPDSESGDSMISAGTVYHRDLFLEGEPIEDELNCGDPIVATSKDDYELLEDGTLKLSTKFMKGFNKNDVIRLQFLDEPDADLIPYRIVSKVIYEDGDYYHCELNI